jgi:hypothetical protein
MLTTQKDGVIHVAMMRKGRPRAAGALAPHARCRCWGVRYRMDWEISYMVNWKHLPSTLLQGLVRRAIFLLDGLRKLHTPQ